MRKLMFLVALLGGLWVAGEVAVVPFAESRLAGQVAEHTGDVADVRADIRSFPLVARTVLTGEVRRTIITFDDITRRGLTFAEVGFDLSGIEVDRGEMLQRRFRVKGIETGTATATIDLGDLSPLAGRIANLVAEQVSVSGSVLRIGPASFPLANDILPCEPDARLDGERVTISCTIHDVPPVLLDALQAS